MSLFPRYLVQQHSGPLHKRKRVMQPQTDEQRETSLRLDSQKIHQQSRCKDSCSARFRTVSKELDCSPDSTELGQRNSSHQCRVCRGGAGCLGWWKVQSSARCHDRARPQQNKYRVAPTRQNWRLMTASGPNW